MGGKQCKPVVDPARCCNRVTTSELSQLQQEFCQLSENDSIDGKIEASVFLSYLAQLLRGRFSQKVCQRLLAVINTEGNANSISYRDFLWFSIVLNKGFHDEKLKMIFNMFDLEANGKITKKNFSRISAYLYEGSRGVPKKLSSLIDMHTLACFEKYHRQLSASSMNYNEWRNYSYDDDLIQSFLECLLSRGDKTAPSEGFSASSSDFSTYFTPHSSSASSQSLVFPPPFASGTR